MPLPGHVVLHLAVSEPGQIPHATSRRLYRRAWNTSHLPDVGDPVTVCWEAGNIDDGAQWPVRYRWWDGAGVPHLRLADMVVDPPENQPSWLFSSHAGRPPRASAWYSAAEGGTPYDRLVRCGWTLQ